QPMPPVDYTRQTVIIASTGAFIGTEGLRQVAIKDICPNQLNGLTVTIRRGDPLGGCDGGNTVVAPYVVAIMDSINPEVSFAEEQFDTCPPGECLDVVWNEVAYGDAALNGYTGPAFTLVARNQNEYEDLAGPLLGNEPLPPVDFVTQRVLVMTSGLANDELGFRFLLPTEVCLMDGRPARVTYETGEYLSCTSSDIDATAPFSLVVVDDTSASIELAAFVKLEFDICGPPSPCDDPVPYEILVQADVHDLGEGTALFQMIRNTEDLTRVWSQYFPWLQRPTIDFAEKDLFFFAFGPTYGDESRFRLDGICYDALNDQVFAHYTGFYPMSCPPPGEDAPIGQLVNVVVTDKLPPEASPFFLGNYEDLCEIPDCGGPPPVEIIEEGDGGMVWGAPGLDAVIDNQDMYERLWEVFHPSANPPAVDFSQFNVIFSIMDFREEGGGGMYRNEIVTVCSTPEDGPNVQLLQYGPDPGCPPAPPVPSAPYVFATSAKITSPNVAWHRFNRTAVPYCE
ncbi:MAG TPA: hypothetical protein VEI97_06715, partial [bacterium]|nr:hypothetical protein [bacterium]